MPLVAPIIALLMSAAAADEPPITVKAYPWAPFISPMGEPFRGRATAESPIARWFGQADANRDGVLTADEMQADADRFFAKLDDNHDGQIDPQEITTYEWEVAPDVQVNTDWKRPRGDTAPKPEPDRDHPFGDDRKRGDRYDGYRLDGLQGGARYGLLNIPQPVASADADFNRAVTLAEFRQAASTRFKLLDSDGQGRLTLAALEARLPTRPKGKGEKHRKGEFDSRVGQPLPKGD
ncbi:EF-hand domain-containing protein [Sphingomonas sp. RB56-2]|uniref:EF-hand domain-containing protein n=1 Tax=Sphingomonas brevis TaxID=2908206 RepID=A0ABT0S7H3_9SPHN|nr:EF-hand domain-containing protein [Sphingomonas brevis]MCL6740262.1 EF-hand domain-containing protein [Sphingomonas brevis]